MRMFVISDEDIGFIGSALHGRPTASHRDNARERLYAIRDNAAADLEEPPAEALARLQRELAIATQQRDFLSGQVNSLVQRLAASLVSQGLIDMAAAQGFVQKEILPINQVLAQIAAANSGEPAS